ncbi:TPA: restriction endonuclease subunit S [Escherichia coli]|uniref:restriction endonuclease subunit S n=1 Tax=Escherichia coli TaxID=562 RepID=UPI0007A0E01C|nr:restriction endonuclease subunit S [Escherichia coli]EJM1769595.1 restriction endonuclease subunit S [Escherichia albertii]EFG3399428.1 restriction endonuclease subunit S [Escherichia coli]EFG3959538.1 restriction endonuclease subunit S [Escherichia coli]EFG7923273.1 restriction endonuclease subunit S [Escherichia coli]EIO6609331.1 restriction endonuclease subunit S [Escherichia coli]
MSELSYLEKLLDGVEVEWLPLGEITKYEQPTKYLVKAKDYHDTYTIPVLTAGKTFILGYTNETHGIYQASKAPVIIFDDFTTANKWVDFDFKAKSSAMKMVTSCDDNKTLLKYVYYWLNTLPSEFAEGDHKRQWISNYSQKKIPIPCPDNPEKSLAIQSEIVRILDKFSALTAELTAELSMRKKQYNYYRDQLLSFKEDEVEGKRKTLGEIMKMRAGQHISAHNIIERKEESYIYPCFGGNGIRGYVKEKSHDGEHLLIGRQGALCGNVQRMKGQFYATEHAVVVSVMPGINIDWAFHMLTAMNLNQYASKSAQPGLAVGKLQELKLFVPSIERQIYIAAILDKFDTLTNSITEGLPREIELRQKQYEYYRDMLFSFLKPEVAEA